MVPRATVLSLAAALLAAAPAHASSAGSVAVTRCDKSAQTVVFEGRISAIRHAGKMQMRFTLQTRGPEAPAWSKVSAAGFGVWITAPRGLSRYLYDKTVENLVAPASYRAVVDFRWRDASGHVLRRSRAASGVCKQPDPRPNLAVAHVGVQPAAVAGRRRYVATILNAGRGDAGPFEFDFTLDGKLLGTVTVAGLKAGKQHSVFLTATACTPGQEVTAVADARAAVDESDEDDDALSTLC
jgi:CARDB